MAIPDRENARLLAQADEFASDEHLLKEAARWRAASPEERLAETWRLSEMLPWFRSMWPADVRARSAEPEPLPPDAWAILQRLKARHLP